MKVIDLRMEGRRMEVHLEEVEEQYTDLGRNGGLMNGG